MGRDHQTELIRVLWDYLDKKIGLKYIGDPRELELRADKYLNRDNYCAVIQPKEDNRTLYFIIEDREQVPNKPSNLQMIVSDEGITIKSRKAFERVIAKYEEIELRFRKKQPKKSEK